MKKNIPVFIFFMLCLLIAPAKSADFEDFGDIDRAWDGQKSITNKEFEEVMDALQSNQKKKDEKQRKKLIKKISGGGTSLHGGLEPNQEIKELPELKRDTEGQLLSIPVNIVAGGQVLEKGFYNVSAEKDSDNKIYLLFYQSQFLKGKVPAKETKDDFNEENLNFVKLLPCTDSTVKIIYGSLDFNAYTYLHFKQD